MHALLAGLLAGYGVAIPVGAIGILIMGLSARTSMRVGAGAALGVAGADGFYATIAVLGGAAVASVIAPISGPLRLVAAIVLLGIGLRVAILAWQHHRDPARAAATPVLGSPGRAFLALFGLTLLNPATIIYFVALVLAHRGSGFAPGAQAAFVGAAFAASASWQLLLAAGGSALGRYLAGPRGRLATALVSSLLIITLAAWTLAG